MATPDSSNPPSAAGEVDGSRPAAPVVLLVLRDGVVPSGAPALAAALAAGQEADVVVLDAVSVAFATPLELPSSIVEDHRDATRRVVETIEAATSGRTVEGTVRVGHDLLRIVTESIERHEVCAVVVDESWLQTGWLTPSAPPLAGLRATVDAPVVVPSGSSFRRSISSLLVPVVDEGDWSAVSAVAGAIASANDAWVDLLYVGDASDPVERRDADRRLEARAANFGGDVPVDTWFLEATDVESAIIDQSGYYGLTLVGGPSTRRFGGGIRRSTARRLRRGDLDRTVTVWGSAGDGD